MAEVLGTAVGVISLGIQVCGGLIAYYDSWKDCPKEVSTAQEQVVDLQKTLEASRTALASISALGAVQDAMSRVEQSILACRSGIQELSSKLAKVQQVKPSIGLGVKAQREMQRLLYPFRANTLMKLRDLCTDLRSRLDIALQILLLQIEVHQMQAQKNNQQTLSTIQNVAQSTAIQSKSAARTLSKLEQDIEHVNANIQDLHSKLDSIEREASKVRALRRWLSAPDPSINLDAALRKREPGTGQWLLNDHSYERWRSGESASLWLHGKAGCCKTVMCSSTIENVQDYVASNPGDSLAYFYFSFQETDKQLYRQMLLSIVEQLYRKYPSVPELESAHEQHRTPSIDVLETSVAALSRQRQRTFIIIDALDECPLDGLESRREETISGLSKLQPAMHKSSLLIFSRPEPDIRDFINTLGAKSLALDRSAVNEDIMLYVTNEIARNTKLQKLPEATRQLIIRTFESKAGAMFRWAFCQLQELKMLRSLRPKYVQDALENLPATLDETYERILCQIHPRYRDEAFTALRWLCCAERVLSLAELSEACIVDPAAVPCVDEENWTPAEELLDILSTLVTRGGDSDEEPKSDYTERQNVYDHDSVRLAHFSVKEYLVSGRILDSKANDFAVSIPEGHRFLAQSSIACLLHGADNPDLSGNDSPTKSQLLLDYATSYWDTHQRAYEHSSCPYSTGLETPFLRSQKALTFWISSAPEHLGRYGGVHLASLKDELASLQSGLGTGLYFASVTGLPRTIQTMVERGELDNIVCGAYGDTIDAAMAYGHPHAAGILLRYGALRLYPRGEASLALNLAAEKGCLEVATLLIDHKVDVNAYAGVAYWWSRIAHGRGISPLQAALIGSHEAVAQLLIESGADVNLIHGGEPFYHYTRITMPILHAATNCSARMIGLLLDNGADINCYDNGTTALLLAMRRNDLGTVRYLITRGARVNSTGPYTLSHAPLLLASIEGRSEVAEVLLQAGADPNPARRRIQRPSPTPLHFAIMNGDVQMTRLLIVLGCRHGCIGEKQRQCDRVGFAQPSRYGARDQ